MSRDDGIIGQWNFGPMLDLVEEEKPKRRYRKFPATVDFTHDPLTRADIRGVRAELNLTQQELADLVCVALRTIKAWEHPDKNNSEYRPCSGPARRLIMILYGHPDIKEWSM